MFARMFFRYLSESRQIAYLQEHGTMLGTRIKNGRKAYLYMLRDFCAEVIFKHDDTQLTAEKITTFPTVKDFNNYLEQEFKASY